MTKEQASIFAQKFFPLSVVERIKTTPDFVKGKLVFTTSFGLEDQVITHFIAQSGVKIEFATLDTGRLFPQTYALWQETEEKYEIKIHGFYPDREIIEEYIEKNGINGFYHSVEARHGCCNIRKVEPLARALKGADGWITGLRADQSSSRGKANFVEWNDNYSLLKFNPLLDWSRDRAATFVIEQNIPINPLHEKGFISIGCAPCTRAIEPGEDERAGRWWWENEDKKECGLHLDETGRIVRHRG